MIERALIVDTETTGLDPAKAELIEVGLILYSVTNQCTLQQFSSLYGLQADSNAMEAVNRIPTAALKAMDRVTRHEDTISRMIEDADCFVAHNAAFDSKWFPRMLLTDYPDREWLCTLEDFVWPNHGPGGLINIALAHGIGVSSAHRALTDCQLIAALFDRMPDLPEMFRVAKRPKGLFVADVPYPGTEAKAAGFRWNEIVTKQWARWMAVEDASKLNFRTRQVA